MEPGSPPELIVWEAQAITESAGQKTKDGGAPQKDSSGVLQRVPLESRRDPPKEAQKIISRAHTVLEILDISTSQNGNPCTSRSIR